MDYFAPPVERLIEEFARLPGIGQKSAQRLAFHVLDMPKEDAERFASAIREAKEKTFTCKRCQNLTDSEARPSRVKSLKRWLLTTIGFQPPMLTTRKVPSALISLTMKPTSSM